MLERLKELVFESDNKACFIERERILANLEKEMDSYSGEDKYALILAKLLAQVSTPVWDCDYFAGRVVEALPDEGMKAPNLLLFSTGHMSFDYAKLLRLGLKGILEEIEDRAAHKGDEESRSFAKNARIVVLAVKEYADRYARAAEEKGFTGMAEALKRVPYEPAYDYYSALQSIWLVHMIASCYVGSRDYAFGRFDQYMLPFYEQALAKGGSRKELTELLAGFFIKTNEICGRTTHNFDQKPILSHSSKQYLCIGGEKPNPFSAVVLDAAARNCMPQPQITVLLKEDAEESFTKKVFEALTVLTDKLHIYHYDSIKGTLLAMGLPEEIAKDFTFSACCTFDLHYHSFRLEYYVPVPQIFLEVLHGKEYTSLAELTENWRDALTVNMQKCVDEMQKGFEPEQARRHFVLDAILLSDSASECRYACDCKAKYNVVNLFCPGIATIGDSLMVLDRLVFKEKRYTYGEFVKILQNDFENQESLRQEILAYTMFGNDTGQDDYTVMAGNAFLDAVDAVQKQDNFYLAPGFYSLERENSWSETMGATPNGRKAGEPFSENQSPTYGADKNGITALLKSLAKLPFERTISGGLNLTFAKEVPAEILQALVLSYFRQGGFQVGISVVDREKLQDAMRRPELYKSLTVRLYGFSEYFVSLPKWQQLAVLNRTEYQS